MDKLKLVLDSNEYVFYYNNKSDLLLKIIKLQNAKIFINNMIFREVIRNIKKDSIKYFFGLLKNPKIVAIAEKMPKSLIEKYKSVGLRKGDIVISALCEFVKANYLITENRHFLKFKVEKFKIATAEDFLRKF